MAFSGTFQILTAMNAKEGLEIIQDKHQEIGVLLTDQRMPGGSGVELLEKVRESYPSIIRILVTAYADIESAIEAVNNGAIYKYISKPWDVNELKMTLMRGLDFFEIQKERDHLLKEKMSVVQQIMSANQEKDLAIFAAGMKPLVNNSIQAIQQLKKMIPTELLTSNKFVRRDMATWAKIQSKNIFDIMSTCDKYFCIKNHDFEKPQTVEEIFKNLFSDFEKDNGVAIKLNIAQNISASKIRVNIKLVTILFNLLVNKMAKTSETTNEKKLTITIQEATESDAIEILIDDSQEKWTSLQRIDFFRGFGLHNEELKDNGCELIVCLFIVYHHFGKIELPGNEESKLTVRLPLEEALLRENKNPDNEALFGLFYSDKSWDHF